MNSFLVTHSLCMQFQALDSFISTIPSFEGDSPIPAIPISVRTPSAKSVGDSLTGPSAGPSKTQASKRKEVATPPPLKKPQMVMSKKALGIKNNDPAPKSSPTPTPPKCTWGRFTIR
jgi:hypothetical protein